MSDVIISMSFWVLHKQFHHNLRSKIALESLGPINQSDFDFISEVGHRSSVISGDPLEKIHLCDSLPPSCGTPIFVLLTTNSNSFKVIQRNH